MSPRGLVILAFVATVCAALAAAEPHKTTSDTWALRRPFQDDILYRRFLTARKLTDDERAVSTSSVESLIKSTVSTEQLNAWLKRGDTTNYVFKALKLQNAGDGLLDNPHLTAWISYLKLFNEANPTKKTTLIATLTSHYGNQD
ncbi:hypothetical protein JG687_00011020 [Phytophthora cactorum]|uniref:RxLR effector PexRD54 WY domain-containing protein n=1 Tax=Phytophthora cactorum TaxID=29920 RepID=A0A8T1U5S1_9STRA|nr:hypothetical protein JG687_00011020 [Phytophthora cactorum]